MSAASREGSGERLDQLLMKAVDGELTAAERQEFERMLKDSPERRREFEEYQRIKEVTTTMKFGEPSQEVWNKYWLGVYNRLERGLAWISISIGAIILITYALYNVVVELLGSFDEDPIIKTGALLLLLGLVVLVVSVIREKLSMQKSDPYKEVKQ